jgi:CO/xanthine dehydrogenase Mo-binding subunit
VLVESSDSIVNPLGARGLGELPMAAAAAIANAVFDETGKRVRDPPSSCRRTTVSDGASADPPHEPSRSTPPDIE